MKDYMEQQLQLAYFHFGTEQGGQLKNSPCIYILMTLFKRHLREPVKNVLADFVR